VLPIKENRELSSLSDVFGHQAEDAFIAVGEKIRA
jgi:hypothetical protein